MNNNRFIFRRNKLVIAMGLALVGSAMSGCSSDDDSDTDTDSTASITIKANGGLGGNADNAYGGDGGELILINDGSTGGVEMRKTGKASANFTSPNIPQTTNLGSNPLNVTSDLTLSTPIAYTQYADAAAIALIAGTRYVGTDNVLRSSAGGANINYAADTAVADNSFYRNNSAPNELYQAIGDDTAADLAAADMAYLRSGNSTIYQTDADDTTADPSYSGLSVAENTTLTLSDNQGCDSNIYVSNDIVNDGTITAENNDCSLRINSGHIYFGNGTITTAGTETSVDGGELYLYANQGIDNKGTLTASGYTSADGDGGDGGEVFLHANGYILNSGSMLSTGGDGLNNAGDGGEVNSHPFDRPTYIENTGIMNANGGNHTGDGGEISNGGSGGSLYMYAYVATNIRANSTMTANGGNGGNGGSGGSIELNSQDSAGFVANATDLNANGGNGSTSNGGSGGRIDINGYSSSDVYSSGNLSAVGGNTTDPSSNAGSGGDIDIYASYNGNQATGNIEVSGNLNVSGGNANETGEGNGGNGGDVRLYSYSYNVENSDARIALLGYDQIDVNGGDGANGGSAQGNGDNGDSAVYVVTDTQYVSSGNYKAGPIANDIPINAMGGNTVATGTSYGQGGDGGEVAMEFWYDYTPTNSDITITNTATINVSGGDSYDNVDNGIGSGNGGGIDFEGYNDVTNSGMLTANAGEGGTNSFSNGNNGGYVDFSSNEGDVANTGTITVNGSEAIDNGGDGGSVDFSSGSGDVSNSAAIAANGDEADGNGGDGGSVVFSSESGKTSNTASITANGSNAIDNGGDGGTIDFNAVEVSNTASLTVNGANGTDVTESYGGDGGYIELTTNNGVFGLSNSGNLSYDNGTGTTEDGTNGCAVLNFVTEGECSVVIDEET